MQITKIYTEGVGKQGCFYFFDLGEATLKEYAELSDFMYIHFDTGLQIDKTLNMSIQNFYDDVNGSGVDETPIGQFVPKRTFIIEYTPNNIYTPYHHYVLRVFDNKPLKDIIDALKIVGEFRELLTKKLV